MTDRELSERVISTVAAYLHSDYCIGDCDGRLLRVEGQEGISGGECPPAAGWLWSKHPAPCEWDRDRDLCHAQDAANCCTMIRLRRTSSSFELDRGGSFRRVRIGCLDRPEIRPSRAVGHPPAAAHSLGELCRGVLGGGPAAGRNTP